MNNLSKLQSEAVTKLKEFYYYSPELKTWTWKFEATPLMVEQFLSDQIEKAYSKGREEVVNKIITMPLPKRLTLARPRTLSILDIYRDELILSIQSKGDDNE